MTNPNTTPIAALECDAIPSDALEVVRIEGREQLSRPFRFVVTVVQKKGEPLELDDVIGEEMRLVLTRASGDERFVHGMVREIVRQSESAGRPTFAIELVPRLLRASYVTGIKIHLDVKVDELLRTRLEMLGFAAERDFLLRLSSPLPPRRMVVQYAESDFDFISRLLEQYGLAYHFEHEADREVLVVTDSTSGFGAPRQVRYDPRADAAEVLELWHARKLCARSFVCRDYNYRTPTLLLSSAPVTLEDGDLGGVYEFGLHADTIDEATELARRTSEEHLARRDEHRGKSRVVSFAPGQKIKVDGRDQETPELLLVEVTHALWHAADGAPLYENTFIAIPSDRMPRPARVTPQPRIHGLVHAVIQTDALGTVSKRAKIDAEGRYYVKFRFDPAATEEQASSCPVRMVQASAGPSYGVHFPLRPGVEVLVAFIGGDPDRPIIVGAAPNAVTPSPVGESTSHKNRIKTASGAMIELDDGT